MPGLRILNVSSLLPFTLTFCIGPRTHTATIINIIATSEIKEALDNFVKSRNSDSGSEMNTVHVNIIKYRDVKSVRKIESEVNS